MADSELAKLVEAHHGAVVAVAFAVTRDLALAEDVAQETFVAAWGERAKLRGADNVRAWLCGIARNQARVATRRRWREVGGVETEAADPEPSVLVGAVAREQTNELRAALDVIPEDLREPLVLFYWQDKSIAQVASALDISKEAAQKRLSRARAYLKSEMEAPLEQQGRGRRSAAAAAAAVLAVVATARASEAAAATKGAGMTTAAGIKVFGLLAAAGLAVGAVAMARGDASDAAPASEKPAGEAAMAVPVARAARTPSSPPREPALPAKDEGTDPGIEAAKGRLPVPAGYEITVLSPRSVEIDLAGGKASAFSPDNTPAPALKRHITGRVVDAAQRPVAGAVVVVGDRLGAYNGGMFGSGAAKTGADGRFDAVVHEDAASFAIALHPRGWSGTVAVPAGTGDADLGALAVGAPGTIAVHAKQHGAPRAANVLIRQPSNAVVMTFETDANGDLSIPLLGPGTYRLEVRATQAFGAGTSDPVVREVTLGPNSTTDLPIDLPNGAVVTASAFKPGMETVEYFFLSGIEPAELGALKKLARSGQVMSFLLGGRDAPRGAEFHDIAPGPYTVCVDAATLEAHYPFKCQRVDVPSGKEAIDVAVDVGPLTKAAP